MKRLARLLGFLVLGVVLGAGGFALNVHLSGIPRYEPKPVDLKVEVTPDRVARGRRHVSMLCAGCHMNPTTGALTGKHMTDAPPQFGTVYSLNITQDAEHGIGAWTDGEIAYLLRTGIARDGRYTPPWMAKLPHMSDEDMHDIIAFLRSEDPMVQAAPVADRLPEPSFLTKFLSRVAFKPLPYPTRPISAPPETDRVAYGGYLVKARLDCYGCHSADFAKVNVMVPEKSAGYLAGGNAMPDMNDRTVYTANLTMDVETGIGNWSEDQFHRALTTGIRPDNRPLRYPMEPYRELTRDEVSAIFAYLKSVPIIRNPVPASEPLAIPESADRGKVVYYKYGCQTCHGDTGLGLYDLRPGLQELPTNEALIAHIKHPEIRRPGTRMPTWDGVILEEEYPALGNYVRSLGM
jgi:mono/diheme cytochrome c family protein